MKNKCFKEISDFEKLTESNDIKICFLHDHEFGYTDDPKRPEGLTRALQDVAVKQFLEEKGVTSFDELDIAEDDYIRSINGKFNYRTAEEANLNRNANRNLGIVFPKVIESDEFWVCLDIDGQDSTYMVNADPELKIATRYFLFQCIKHGLTKRGIKFLAASTYRQGFHIYFKTTEANFRDHGFNIFTYPSSYKMMSEIAPNIIDMYPKINSIIGKQVNNNAIEIFTRAKYVVAPGSVIDGKKYALLSDGVQSFGEVSVYRDGPVEELIKDILSEDCFFLRDFEKEEEIKDIATDLSLTIPSSNDLQAFSDTNIRNIGNLILNSFPHIPNQKHQATLALGGFLQSRNIDQKSIMRLGEYIVDHAPPTLFRQSKDVERSSGFVKTLVHDAIENAQKKKTGLNTLTEIFRDTSVSLREFTEILWTNSAPQFHRFYPDGKDSVFYKEIRIDFMKNETYQYDWQQKRTEEDISYTKRSSKVIRHVLTDFNYIDDISASKLSRLERMPISFCAKSNVMDDCTYIFDDTQTMLREYQNIPLAHSSSSTNILSHIINEYESIGLIGMVEGSKHPGIYMSRDKKTLRRFIKISDDVVECDPVAPKKEDLIHSLKLLRKINDAYPWFDDKFATFAKLGMILPYGYVFKTEYRSFIRGIILYGEAGTCKSSASEMVVYMNVPAESIEQKEIDYLIPGSEFATEYRMGVALSRHSYPIAIEEVENVFDKPENRDLIKNSITRRFIRKPGGENPKEYYARAIPVFSANELTDEVEKSGMFRRFLILNFVSGERGDKKEVEKALEFLNENGVRNSRFKELYPISEYIFYDLSNHLEYFAKSPQGIIDCVLRDMEKYTQMDLGWLLEAQFDKYYQIDRSSEDQTELSMVLDTLKYHMRNSIKFGGVGSNASEQFLEQLIEDKYPYMYRIRNRKSNGVLITSDFNKSYKKNYPEAKKVSLDRLAELLNTHLDLSQPIEKKKVHPTGFKQRMSGIFISWSDFCSIFGIHNIEDKEEE